MTSLPLLMVADQSGLMTILFLARGFCQRVVTFKNAQSSHRAPAKAKRGGHPAVVAMTLDEKTEMLYTVDDAG
jgi:hypothetical protein